LKKSKSVGLPSGTAPRATFQTPALRFCLVELEYQSVTGLLALIVAGNERLTCGSVLVGTPKERLQAVLRAGAVVVVVVVVVTGGVTGVGLLARTVAGPTRTI
jgi:hypothetical protein